VSTEPSEDFDEEADCWPAETAGAVKTRRGAAKGEPGGFENSIVRSIYLVKHRAELEEATMVRATAVENRKTQWLGRRRGQSSIARWLAARS